MKTEPASGLAGRGAVTIPVLPAVDIHESIACYQALGFELALRQKSPNAYAVVREQDFELHLFGLPRLVRESNYSTCLVIVGDVERRHEEYRDRLAGHLGRSVYRNLPRLSRMRVGQTRFTLTDPSGNSVIFVKHGGEDDESAQRYKQLDLSPLERAVALAERERDFKTDDLAAARTLDRILDRYAGDTSATYVRAVRARLELALVYDDVERAEQLRRLLAGD